MAAEKGVPGALSLFGGTVIAAALAVVAVVAALESEDRGSGSSRLQSYYFRATIEVEQDEAVLGNNDVLGAVLAWYQAPDHWRWDFGDPETEPDRGSVQVSDGETVVYYDRETNTYTRQALDAYNAGRPAELTQGPPLFAGSFIIGWLPYGNRERFFDAWLDGAITEADGGTVAGRLTDAVTVTRQGVSVTLWIDRDLPFVLKYEVRSTGGPLELVRVQVVELELNERIEDTVFRFDPPPLALEVEPPGQEMIGSSGSGQLGRGTVTAPEGFLSPAYVPERYVVVREEGSSSAALGGRQTRYAVRLENGASYLSMAQQFRAGGLSETQKQGRPVSAGGVAGYDQSSGEVTRLVFARGDIVVTLEADALDLDELFRIAESLR